MIDDSFIDSKTHKTVEFMAVWVVSDFGEKPERIGVRSEWFDWARGLEPGEAVDCAVSTTTGDNKQVKFTLVRPRLPTGASHRPVSAVSSVG